MSWAIRVGVLATLLSSAGCSNFEKQFWESYTRRPEPAGWVSGAVDFPGEGGPHAVAVLDELLGGKQKRRTASGIWVAYPAGREAVAIDLAELLARAWTKVESEFGRAYVAKPFFVWHETDSIPESLTFLTSSVDEGLPMVIYARPGEDSAAVLRRNQVLLGIWMHECCEASLLVHQGRAGVLPDGDVHFAGLARDSNNYTRWFRDGLAQYASYRFLEEIDRVRPGVMRSWERGLFASLDRLIEAGPGLFDWAQGEDDESTRDYQAAGALFLLIRDEFGPDAIPTIVHRLAELEYPDGRAVEDLMAQVIGTEPRQFVAALRGEVGIRMAAPSVWSDEVAVRPGSLAERAGLRDGDIIRTVGGDPSVDFWRIEFALRRARRTGDPIELGVDRRGRMERISIR